MHRREIEAAKRAAAEAKTAAAAAMASHGMLTKRRARKSTISAAGPSDEPVEDELEPVLVTLAVTLHSCAGLPPRVCVVAVLAHL
jgi:hypothetical protein